MKLTTVTLASSLLCVLLSACTAPTGEGVVPAHIPADVPDPLRPSAWTSAFREPALLFADTITIEGPRGLLDHFAARSVLQYHAYEAETLPEGFRQTFTVRSPDAGVELRGYLDALEVVALQQLIVIEKPGELDVLVSASGNVYWRESATGREQRAPVLSFVGPIDSPADVTEDGAQPESPR